MVTTIVLLVVAALAGIIVGLWAATLFPSPAPARTPAWRQAVQFVVGFALGVMVVFFLVGLVGGSYRFFVPKAVTPAATIAPCETCPTAVPPTPTAVAPTTTTVPPTPVPATPTQPAVQQPAAPAPEPTAVPPTTIQFTSLNYDETNLDRLTTGQRQLVALYFREAMKAGSTQAAIEAAIKEIQQDAAAAKATTFEGATLKLDQHWAWLVWCSDASGVDYPTDTSDVFDKLAQGPGRVWIQVPFASGVPLRTKDSFSGCNGKFWAVAIH